MKISLTRSQPQDKRLQVFNNKYDAQTFYSMPHQIKEVVFPTKFTESFGHEWALEAK